MHKACLVSKCMNFICLFYQEFILWGANFVFAFDLMILLFSEPDVNHAQHFSHAVSEKPKINQPVSLEIKFQVETLCVYPCLVGILQMYGQITEIPKYYK